MLLGGFPFFPKKSKGWRVRESSSKVDFGGSLGLVKSRCGSRFYCGGEEENLLSDLLFDLFDYFLKSPETYFCATFGLLYFFGDFGSCG